ncbi:alpha/beta hydrolase [Acidihalobacter yilgarnensis]|uniref:Alpha/beta hydrolase n=2 Tax=Acidihalobacter yilgarnensis TaxID=2819280 RepID=A0A1D8IN07_9GAMM|nr:alpha/beta hydrolase [Acidihalobacter yilgarnensis]
MPDKRFHPAWWLPGAHLQTLWPFVFARSHRLNLRRERFELSDGDFIDLDWSPSSAGPLVLILHGLEGSSDSAYIRRLVPVLQTSGFEIIIMHFRGCSGEPNRLARAYHAGDTQDVAAVVARLQAHAPERAIGAIGFSLGGNVLLKWLGETGAVNPLAAAAAISVPFDLHAAADRLERGFSRIYQSYLLRPLRKGQLRKLHLTGIAPPITCNALLHLRTLRDFDDRITAPLHGFENVDDYYTRASCRPWLRHIVTPTLIVQARNDPFLLASGIPSHDELSPSIRLELMRSGGHVGFISGPIPGLRRPWLERHLSEWLMTMMTRPKEAKRVDKA